MMIPFDGTPVVGLAGACARAINADLSCDIGRDRNRAMAGTPSIREEQRVDKPRPACGGKSILEMLWDELLEVYGQILAWKPAYTDPDHPDWIHQEDAEERGSLKGQALGLAQSIAIIVNPYAPNVDAVRIEARSRWEAADA